MFNALKYIKKLEEVGFPREQAEAQLQIVIDVIEGELATKEDMNALRSDIKKEIAVFRSEVKEEIATFRGDVKEEIAAFRSEVKEEITILKTDMVSFKQEMAHQFTHLEYKIVTRLGALVVTTVTLAVLLSSWLMKVK